ncbi:MFS transporter [Candidimonas nitroreducens]|uniref:MFS transporter n=1 Tax=Candidimonas nitroreducens TaxID=683354 RepID=UPI001E430F93|nr:MFS transporter [Candidimonas nitroreducens]
MKRDIPAWIAPVAAILVLQTAASFLSRLIPIVSPSLIQDFGWNNGWVGYLAAINTAGSLFFLMVGTGFIHRIGNIRSVQWGVLMGTISMALFFSPIVALAAVASFIIGAGYGVSSPAGSEILQRYSPPSIRNLVFSIKQAGVPLGGVIAGLTIPLLAESAGWRVALLAAALLAFGMVALTWRLGRDVDTPARSAQSWLGALSLHNILTPIRALREGHDTRRLAAVGGLLSATQSCWFTFTVAYLVDRLDFTLSMAGLVFAIMQAAGVAGRIVFGWLADRIGSARVALSLTSVGSAATTALLALSTQAWPLWVLSLLAAGAGATAAGWNGVQIAEMARRAPPDKVSEAAAGSTLHVYLANTVAPAVFAAYVSATGQYEEAFMAAAVCSLGALALLARIRPH